MANVHQRADYSPAILAAAHRIIAAIDPRLEGHRPDLRLPAPVIESLTEREREILQCLANDMSPKEIARDLLVSYHTIRAHLENIRCKLGKHSTTGVVAFALRTQQIQ